MLTLGLKFTMLLLVGALVKNRLEHKAAPTLTWEKPILRKLHGKLLSQTAPAPTAPTSRTTPPNKCHFQFVGAGLSYTLQWRIGFYHVNVGAENSNIALILYMAAQ